MNRTAREVVKMSDSTIPPEVTPYDWEV